MKLFFGSDGDALTFVAEFADLKSAADYIESNPNRPSCENNVLWFIPDSGVTDGWGGELGYSYRGDRIFERCDCPDGNYTILDLLTV